MKQIIIVLLKVYKETVSKVFTNLFGYGCRFNPTCSEYSLLAIEKHGAYEGTKLSLKRLSSCHPFSTKHYDPVPNKLLK